MSSDAALKAKTGCTWERWGKALDRVQAHTWPHRRIAGYVHEKVQIQHAKLPDRGAATKMKDYWAGRLAALQEVLA